MTEVIKARLREPSTYAGIAGIIAGAAFIPNAAAWADLIIAIGGVVAAALAVIMPEGK